MATTIRGRASKLRYTYIDCLVARDTFLCKLHCLEITKAATHKSPWLQFTLSLDCCMSYLLTKTAEQTELRYKVYRCQLATLIKSCN